MSYLKFLDPEQMIPISRATTEVFKTGSWSRTRPVFQEKASPCNAACPNANNIAAAMYRAAEGDYDGALGAFLEETPLPGVCGRVCSHPCQSRCNRAEHDGSVGVRALERSAADFGDAPPERLTEAGKGLPVAIVGSGPAGLAAAYHLARMGHPVTLYEARERLGGLLTRGIPAYRLPKDVVQRDLDRILALGVEVVTGCRVDAARMDSLLAWHRAVLLATGAGAPNVLGIAGEELEGVRPGLDFLLDEELQAEATDRRVVVIGGGNTAIDAARVALRKGAAAVAILYRPDLPALPPSDDEVREAADEGIFRFTAHPAAFVGVEGRIAAVRCKEIPAAEATERWVSLPVAPGEFPEVPCDLVITAIGQSVRPSSVYGELRLEGGRIVADRFGRTARSGVYLAGEAGSTRATVVDAMASGKAAALTIHFDLTGRADEAETIIPGDGSGFSIKEALSESRKVPGRTAQVNRFSYLTASAAHGQVQPTLDPALRCVGFHEVVKGLSRHAAATEAKRCFYCGSCIGCNLCATYCPEASMGKTEGQPAYACNAEYCKGCGACAAVCVRGVLTMGDEQ